MLCAQNTIYPEECSEHACEEVYRAAVGWNILYVCWAHSFNSVNQVCRFLIGFLSGLSSAAGAVLKFPNITGLLSVSPLSSSHTCIEYLGAPMLGECIFIINVSSWLIDPFDNGQANI